VPGGSDVCVIGHALHAVCVSVRRKFAERHTPDAKMHYFLCVTQTRLMPKTCEEQPFCASSEV